jgi:hypothetical protein
MIFFLQKILLHRQTAKLNNFFIGFLLFPFFNIWKGKKQETSNNASEIGNKIIKIAISFYRQLPL